MPTSRLFLACAESTLAPSTPTNTQRVINIVLLICSSSGRLSFSPLKSYINCWGENAQIAQAMKRMSGNTLTMVAIKFTYAASLMPLAIKI